MFCRWLIDGVNRLLSDYAKEQKFTWLDLGAKFVDGQGAIPKALMPDLCHPNEKGYQIWADALSLLLNDGNDSWGLVGLLPAK
jgi:beta-glucosidase